MRFKKILAAVIAVSLVLDPAVSADKASAKRSGSVSSYEDNSDNGIINGRKLKTASEESEKKINITDAARFTVNSTGGVISFDDNGFSYTAAGQWGNEIPVDVVVPAEINGIKVRAIDGAFSGNESIRSIVLPDGIESFINGAFSGCRALVSMQEYDPSDDVTEDGVQKAVVKEYEDGAVTVPYTVNTIDSTAFTDTESVRRFSVSASSAAFTVSTDQALLLDKSRTRLVRYASANHVSDRYEIPEGITDILDSACEHAMDTVGFAVPDSVQTIGNHAFEYGGNLLNVRFTENSKCTVIGAYAFSHNPNIETSLPQSVKSIGIYCFAYCPNLRETAGDASSPDGSVKYVSGGLIEHTQITEIPDFCFYQSSNLHNVIIPAAVRRIGAYAFADIANINTVTFTGSSLSEIGTGAFQDAQNLHEVTIPSGVTSIEDSTFDGCQNLNKVVLPETVTNIGENAFKDCRNIHELVIPENVTHIADSSFTGANVSEIDTSRNSYAANILKGEPLPSPSVTPAAVIPALDTSSVPVTPGTVFRAGKYKYRVAVSGASRGSVVITGFKNKKLKKRTTVVKVPSKVRYKGVNFKVTAVKSRAFANSPRVVKIVIGKNVKKIGSKSFFGCRRLRAVSVTGKKVRSVGAAAFGKASKKAVIHVPKKNLKKYRRILKNKGIRRIR